MFVQDLAAFWEILEVDVAKFVGLELRRMKKGQVQRRGSVKCTLDLPVQTYQLLWTYQFREVSSHWTEDLKLAFDH